MGSGEEQRTHPFRAWPTGGFKVISIHKTWELPFSHTLYTFGVAPTVIGFHTAIILMIGNLRDRVTALRLGRRQRDGAQAGAGTPGRGREGGLEIAQRGEDGLRDNSS